MAKDQPLRLEATYVPVSKRAYSRSAHKRAHWRSNLRIRTSGAMTKVRSSTPEAAYAPVTKRASSRSSHQWSSAIVLLNATNRCD